MMNSGNIRARKYGPADKTRPHDQQRQDLFIPKDFKSECYDYRQDYPLQCEYSTRKYHESTRLQHNGSTVSDNASTIPWTPYSRKSARDEEMVCDSSTSPSNHDRFVIPSDPARKISTHYVNGSDDFSARPLPHMIPAEFLDKISRRSNYPDNTRSISTAASTRSTVLPDYLNNSSRNSSSFSSPRHSARGMKRMLSASPISSEILDLTEIIRTSPNSLVAFVLNNENKTQSRNSGCNSSAASMRSQGSYGHLSPSPFSTPISSTRRNIFATPTRPVAESPSSSFYLRKKQPANIPHCHSQPPASETAMQPVANNTVSSSTGEIVESSHFENTDKSTMQNEDDNHQTEEHEESNLDSADEEDDEKAPDSFQCLWKDCQILCDSQAQLAQHVNAEHIQKNKKDCTCYWSDCSREEKPFKAMYMLVVHVRRHTGEKPHKCHYQNCTKAYSRLENLKTHIRSHTGERPYSCEVVGCTKAFSNASDRAKHQNRTHSSVKQYGCKIPGCPKRYTDPSSLRKHMKTVHGTLPQPTKKFKGDPSTPKTVKEKNYLKDKIKTEPDEDNEKQNKKEKESCANIKQQLILNYINDSNHGSPSYNPTSTTDMHAVHHRDVYDGGYGGSSQTFGGGGNYDYGNVQRMWGVQEADSSTNMTNEMLLSRNDFMPRGNGMDHQAQRNIEIQAQPRLSINDFATIVKPIVPAPLNDKKIFVGNLNKNLTVGSRRGSNASVGSIDSNYQSGSETYSGSRRGSDISVSSYLSGGRRSVNLASPLPPRNVRSPNRITQTVVEGEELDCSYQMHTTTTCDSKFEPSLRDVSNMVNEDNLGVSRMSSGYGSSSHQFFNSKNYRSSPAPPSSSREIRRASEGTLRRLSDTNDQPVSLANRQRAQHRRGSEPIKTHNIIDNTPRRHSMSAFNPLPIPQSMQSLQGEQSVGCDVGKGIQYNTTQSDVISAANALQMLSDSSKSITPNRTIQSQNTQQHFQSSNLILVQQSSSQPFSSSAPTIMHADSTVSSVAKTFTQQYDPLVSFVENYDLNQPQKMQTRSQHNSPPFAQANITNTQNHDLSNRNHSIMLQQNHIHQLQQQQRQRHLQQQHQDQHHHQQTFSVPSGGVPSFFDKAYGNIPHPPNNNNNNNNNQMYDFTLQWQNSHFGKQVEPDSTADGAIDDLVLSGFGNLTTETCESRLSRPPTNMVINNLETLLSSLAEENKYFENQTFNRYP